MIRGRKEAAKLQDTIIIVIASITIMIIIIISSSKGENRLNWLRPHTASTKSDKYW